MLLQKALYFPLFLLSTACATSPYPSKAEINDIFSALAGNDTSAKEFWSHVSPTVNWTIEGTHPAAGTYTNRTVLIATFARISATGSKANPLELSVKNIIGGGDEEWSVQELEVKGVCKNGLKFDNRYAWATRWNGNSTIIEARAYLDSLLVSEALQQNELATLFTYSDARDSIVPFVSLPEEVVKEGTGLAHQ